MREKVWVPLVEQIKKAMEVGESSLEGALYFVATMKNILTQTGLLEASKELLEKLDTYERLVRLKLTSNARPWKAEFAMDSGHKNLIENLGIESAHAFKALGIEGALHMDYAISEEGDYIRRYWVEGGGELSDEAVKHLDNIMNVDRETGRELGDNMRAKGIPITIQKLDSSGKAITEAKEAIAKEVEEAVNKTQPGI